VAARLLPSWLRGYRRPWLRADLVAGVVIWSVVTPQAVAYAQIAGLPPAAGLIAAPGALLGYALIGGSRTLVVSATTATSALSASAVGPLAGGDTGRYAALSAAFALVTAAVLVVAGLLRLGAIADLVSKPVMTGFLFGLGMTIAIGQLPKVLGVPDGDGNFFPRLVDLVDDLDAIHWWTAAVGVGSIVALVLLKRFVPRVPGILVVLVAGIVVSAILGLDDRGVDVVGKLPTAYPQPAVPDVGGDDLVTLLGPAVGVMLLTTEAVGVARALATQDGYQVTPSRELLALGVSNVLAGFSQGFVQSGGASQTAAAHDAGGRSQLASVVAGVLILCTGVFLTGLFTDLPQATLGAIVVVAVSGFIDVAEMRRIARLRRSAILLALVALAGVLALGVLPGLVVAAALSLVLVVQRLSRPVVHAVGRDPLTGAWGRLDVHPDWETIPGTLVVVADAPLWYANVVSVSDRVLGMVHDSDPPPERVVLDLVTSADLDVATIDGIADLATALERERIALSLSAVSRRARTRLETAGVTERVDVAPRLEIALSLEDPRTPSPSRP
jgi:sulfate permease, SulP family